MPNRLTIYLAEDNDGHAVLIERNLVRSGVACRFVRFHDGEETVSYFDRPDLVVRPGEPYSRLLMLLDLRMPKLNGIEVLRILKGKESTSFIPIYMLTTSDDPREVDDCFKSGCNAFFIKPVQHDAFAETMRQLGCFLQSTRFPRHLGCMYGAASNSKTT